MRSAERGRWRTAGPTLLAAFAMLLGGCLPDGDQAAEDGRLRVVATTSIVGDLVRNVGGDLVQVESLMGPGVDPHLYKASEGDVRRLFTADVVFYNGLHLEARMAEVLLQMSERKRTVPVAETIDPEQLVAPPEFQGSYDPHVWLNVAMWMHAAEAVRDALMEEDPANADAYRANADRYLAELSDLHEWVHQRIQTVPPPQRVLVTAHDAFNYFGRGYDFEVWGLQGISTAAEAGTADVQRLADMIAQRRIPALFVESSIPPRTVEAVRAAVRSRGFDVVIGGELFSDALGDPDGDAGTYTGMIRHNVNTIVEGLLGENRATE